MNDIYTILGYSRIISKKTSRDLFVIHVSYQRPGVTGYAVDTIFVSPEVIVGGTLDIKKRCHIFYDKRGYCAGVQLIED